jgi:hypothetical protein
MPLITFDPPSETGSRRGGALTGPKRNEYMELCKQMTSRNPSLNYAHIRDEILTILEEDVRAYIQTLPELDRAALLETIDRIFSSINRSDTNYLATINIVSLQISIVFTQYIFTNNPKNKNAFISTFELYEEITETEQWKEYSFIKDFIVNYPKDTNDKWYYLLTPNTEGILFITFPGFLRLNDIVESYFENIFYVGLSYTAEWVDGSYYLPLAYLSHDLFHYDMYSESCPNFPTILNGFKEFRNYVVATQDRHIQYSIDFALFLFLHEEPYCYPFKKDTLENVLQNKATSESIFNRLDSNLYELIDLHNFGKAIPSNYRELIKGSTTTLDEKKVQDYLRLVAERYVVCWKSWERYKQTQEPKSKGGRRRVGSHKQRTLRASRKKRMTRRTNRVAK